jgi:hypothetical protein
VKDKAEKGKPKSLGEKAIEFGRAMAKNMAMECGKVTLGVDWYSGRN